MQSIDTIIRSFGSLFDAGNLDEIVARYAFPLLISKDDTQQVLDRPESAQAQLNTAHMHLRAMGVVETRTCVISQAIAHDTAFVATESLFCDATGQTLKTSRIHYVLRHLEEGWRISVMVFQGESGHVDYGLPEPA